jgi:RNA polymerase sigma-70 factor (ECF subfamily)
LIIKTELNQQVENLKQGDHNALEKIYTDYSPALYGVCLRIVKDNQLAQDVLQEAFVKIWSKATTYDTDKGSFFTWMLNITRNIAIDHYRKIKRTKLISIQNNEKSVHILKDDKMDIPIHHIGLKEIVKKLPKNKIEVIEYMYFKGCTQQETSDELHLPLGTVKTRSRKATASLRNIFS